VTTPAAPRPIPTPTADPEALAIRLQVRLEGLQGRTGVPGVSVAIVWDDGRTWLGAAGMADIATGRPVTTGDAFALASVSKTLTAAVVLQLVTEGALALDQHVAPLLPAYRLDPAITVRMLLDHTSGLPDYFVNPKINKPLLSKPDAAWTPARAWSFMPAKRGVPGAGWAYSNANYLLLGELVTAVTGHPLAREVRTRLLDPLDLGTAWYQGVETPRVDGVTGYRLVKGAAGAADRYVAVAPASDVMPFRSVITAAGSAGSIAATALDAARWMQAFAGGRILPPSMQAAMVADGVRTKALGARVAYGLGIQSVTLDGRWALGHSGRYLGFRSLVLYVPEAGITIAVLTNQGAQSPNGIATLLLREILPKAPLQAPAPSPAPSGGPGATSAAPMPEGSGPAPSPSTTG
jgi:D-alanyl-D-alanine carboxypeptidase